MSLQDHTDPLCLSTHEGDTDLMLYRQAMESKEALELAKAKEATAEAKDKEASSKLAGLLAREQAVADYKDQQAAALQATEAADQVGPD